MGTGWGRNSYNSPLTLTAPLEYGGPYPRVTCTAVNAAGVKLDDAVGQLCVEQPATGLCLVKK